VLFSLASSLLGGLGISHEISVWNDIPRIAGGGSLLIRPSLVNAVYFGALPSMT
jgi:hypothetical protein